MENCPEYGIKLFRKQFNRDVVKHLILYKITQPCKKRKKGFENMTLAEIMKSNGVADEAINAILTAMKENKIFTAGEENLDIRYGKMKADYDNLTAQHNEATMLIEQLKNSAKGNEALQGKLKEYENQIAQLEVQNKQTQLEAEIKVALLSAKASDIDYMTYKLKEKGELEIGEDGKIKGIDDKIAGLKQQFPSQFENNKANSKVIDVAELPKSEPRTSYTKQDILKKPYAERMEIYNADPDAYKEIMNK